MAGLSDVRGNTPMIEGGLIPRRASTTTPQERVIARMDEGTLAPRGERGVRPDRTPPPSGQAMAIARILANTRTVLDDAEGVSRPMYFAPDGDGGTLDPFDPRAGDILYEEFNRAGGGEFANLMANGGVSGDSDEDMMPRNMTRFLRRLTGGGTPQNGQNAYLNVDMAEVARALDSLGVEAPGEDAARGERSFGGKYFYDTADGDAVSLGDVFAGGLLGYANSRGLGPGDNDVSAGSYGSFSDAMSGMLSGPGSFEALGDLSIGAYGFLSGAANMYNWGSPFTPGTISFGEEGWADPAGPEMGAPF